MSADVRWGEERKAEVCGPSEDGLPWHVLTIKILWEALLVSFGSVQARRADLNGVDMKNTEILQGRPLL